MTSLDWHHVVLVLAAYLIGGVSPGYWLARIRGVDIRDTGSSSTGATNAGRVLGKRGFYLVVFLDILKGLVVTVFVAHVLRGVPDAWQFAVALAVVVGHIWPVWLGFRGGKGVATFYGAWCPLLCWHGLIPAGICFALSLILKYVFRRSFKNSWLAVQALYPVMIWWLTRNHADNVLLATISVAMILIIWLAHRKNIVAAFGGRKEEDAGREREAP
jgi:glycerol-3-phosphate acyltransferase PlsY